MVATLFNTFKLRIIMKAIKYFIVILVVITQVGCQDNLRTEVQFKKELIPVKGEHSSYALATLSENEKLVMFGTEYKKFREEWHNKQGQIKLNLEQKWETANWQEADNETREFFKSIDTYPLVSVEKEVMALKILDNVLNKLPQNKGTQEAIAYYTQILISRKSPELLTVNKSLEHLSGYWSDKKISESYKQVLPEAKSLVKDFQFCDECGILPQVSKENREIMIQENRNSQTSKLMELKNHIQTIEARQNQ